MKNIKIKIKNKKLFIGIGIAAVLLIFIIAAAVNANSSSAASSMSVFVEEARKDTIISKVNVSGLVEAKDSEIVYVNTSLKIDDILVELGDKVKKGQKIIEYDSNSMAELEIQLKEAEIALQNAELTFKSLSGADRGEILNAESSYSMAKKTLNDAETSLRQTESNIEQLKQKVKDAEKTVSNNKILFTQGAISKLELDQSINNLNEVKNQLKTEEMRVASEYLNIENAKKQKALAEYNLSTTYNKYSDSKKETEIRIQQNQVETAKMRVEALRLQRDELLSSAVSPMDGTVVEIFAESGSWISQNSPILKISNLDNLIVFVHVSEYDAPTIKPGQKVIFSGDSIRDGNVEGKVIRVAPIATNLSMGEYQEAMVEVEIEVGKNISDLKPGFTVDAEIITAERKDTVVIPLLALAEDDDGSNIVYIVKEDNTVEKRKVELGIYSDLYVEVKGVEEGEKVITNVTVQIEDGMKVKPIENMVELGE